MADVASWQRQNMKKSGSKEPSVSKSNGKSVYPMGVASQMNSKIATPTFALGGLASASLKKPAKPKLFMADGGEVSEDKFRADAEDKARGLEASKDEKVGFFERLRMGNIDDPSSEAYRRFGAGRGEVERAKSLPDDGSYDRRPMVSDRATGSGTKPAADIRSQFYNADGSVKDARYKDTEFGDIDGAMTRAAEAKPAAPATVRKPASAKPAYSKTDTGDESVRLLTRFPKPPEREPEGVDKRIPNVIYGADGKPRKGGVESNVPGEGSTPAASKPASDNPYRTQMRGFATTDTKAMQSDLAEYQRLKGMAEKSQMAMARQYALERKLKAAGAL